jgi:hypothetical protein
MRLGTASWRTWEVWHEAIRDGAVQYSMMVEAYDWLSPCSQLKDWVIDSDPTNGVRPLVAVARTWLCRGG